MLRTVGWILVALAGVVLALGGLWLASGVAGGQLGRSGAVLGFGLLVLVLVSPLLVGGIMTLSRSRREEREDVDAAQMRKVLDIVQTRGAVKVSDLVLELGSGLPAVQSMIYRLVGMGVFSGYVNWDDGVLYSADAAGLRGLTECKKCGGKLTLAGKGVIKCPFCGTEYFVT